MSQNHIILFDTADELEILNLWRDGFDTADIACSMGCEESQVANQLPDILALLRSGAAATA